MGAYQTKSFSKPCKVQILYVVLAIFTNIPYVDIKSRESKSRELKSRESTSIKCHKYRNVRHVPGLSMQNQLMIIVGDRDFSKTFGSIDH